MHTNGIVERHWLRVAVNYCTDTLLFGLSFLLATELRFGPDWAPAANTYWPSITLGALMFASACYVSALYTRNPAAARGTERTLRLAGCYLVAWIAMVALFYVNFSTRIGRGVMLIGCPASMLLIWAHHWLIVRSARAVRERVVLVLTCAEDELELEILKVLGMTQLDIVGVVGHRGFQPSLRVENLGSIDELSVIATQHGVSRIICTHRSINDPRLCSAFCRLRYAGVTVMPLVSLCEEFHQCVPVELVTPEWLMNASASPHILYIKKLKRAFDIITAVIGLVVLSPALLLGVLLVRLSSRGPVFFRQTRVGRFGRHFQLLKLRSMRVDAEKDGPRWAAKNDGRVTPVGRFLRKYRIDEIPQLINVLRGEMSLVGPRPEQPHFAEELTRAIPLFNERLLLQPGITGWAQVNYPYGATVHDARRKLEYDLYYAKHMSLFLDLFSLLDTIRTILKGGAGDEQIEQIHHARTKMFTSIRESVAALQAQSIASEPTAATLPEVGSEVPA